MGLILTISFISGTAFLVVGIGFGWAQRKLMQKRNDYRMGQALRRGLVNPDGVRSRVAPVVQWQECESTSARCS